MCSPPTWTFALAKVACIKKWPGIYYHDGLWLQFFDRIFECFTPFFKVHTIQCIWDDCWDYVSPRTEEGNETCRLSWLGISMDAYQIPGDQSNSCNSCLDVHTLIFCMYLHFGIQGCAVHTISHEQSPSHHAAIDISTLVALHPSYSASSSYSSCCQMKTHLPQRVVVTGKVSARAE